MTNSHQQLNNFMGPCPFIYRKDMLINLLAKIIHTLWGFQNQKMTGLSLKKGRRKLAMLEIVILLTI